MNQILFFILIIILLAVIGYFLMIKNTFSLDKANQALQDKKKNMKNKILQLFERQDSVTNADVEKLFSVSDATATNYLEEMENEGKIRQKGDRGRGVFYTKING